jgi:hypothetical protein
MTPRMLVAALFAAVVCRATPGEAAPAASAASAASAAAKDPADGFMKKMLDAIKVRRYDDFVADGTPKLRALGKPSFTLVSAHFAPLLLGGYKTTYLAKLTKPHVTISLWKLEPNATASEDFEIRLVLKSGKVDAFSIQ